MKKVRNAGEAAILNEAAVRVIRRKAKEGTLVVSEAALFYDVGFEAIRRVVRGETWRHVRDMPTVTALPPEEVQSQAARMFALQQEVNAAAQTAQTAQTSTPTGLARLQEGIAAEQARAAGNLALQAEIGVPLSDGAKEFLEQAGVGER